MSISTRQQIIATSHGSLAVEETGTSDLPVLLIHGNSFCRGVFRNQMQGPIGIEMIPRFPGMRGLMICGAPPVSPNQMPRGSEKA